MGDSTGPPPIVMADPHLEARPSPRVNVPTNWSFIGQMLRAYLITEINFLRYYIYIHILYRILVN